MPRIRCKFSDSFKADAVDLVISSGQVAKVARELGINAQILGDWMKAAEQALSGVIPVFRCV